MAALRVTEGGIGRAVELLIPDGYRVRDGPSRSEYIRGPSRSRFPSNRPLAPR